MRGWLSPASCHRLQRLVQQRVFDRLPCVLVTGKGVPDLGTRCAQLGWVALLSSTLMPCRAGGRAQATANELAAGTPCPVPSRRAFLSCLASAFPQLPLAGLVDWNPAGGACRRCCRSCIQSAMVPPC